MAVRKKTMERRDAAPSNAPKKVEGDAGEVKEIYRVLKPRDVLG